MCGTIDPGSCKRWVLGFDIKIGYDIDAYDHHLKCLFYLCAAYLWSIHDYLAYDKFVGWCAPGRLNCPICMDDTDAFWLQHGKKVSFFYCHQRFLPSNHPFRNETWLLLKGKTVRKGPPKQKIRGNYHKNARCPEWVSKLCVRRLWWKSQLDT
jgi:hypothetical protein